MLSWMQHLETAITFFGKWQSNAICSPLQSSGNVIRILWLNALLKEVKNMSEQK